MAATLTSEQQQLAAQLYLSGMSTRQVAEHFDISLGAAFYALRTQAVPRRGIAESNRLQFEAKPLSYKVREKLNSRDKQLKLAAVMLYWAEGYKVGNAVDFANSDPNMAFLFRAFLSRICGIDERKLRCSLFCYPGQDVSNLTNYWSELLSVPASQFTKPYVSKVSKPGPRGPRMKHGLVHIRYCDKKLLRQLLLWIEELTEECVGGGVVNRDWL